MKREFMDLKARNFKKGQGGAKEGKGNKEEAKEALDA
jgi:hypothetical protein